MGDAPGWDYERRVVEHMAADGPVMSAWEDRHPAAGDSDRRPAS